MNSEQLETLRSWAESAAEAIAEIGSAGWSFLAQFVQVLSYIELGMAIAGLVASFFALKWTVNKFTNAVKTAEDGEEIGFFYMIVSGVGAGVSFLTGIFATIQLFSIKMWLGIVSGDLRLVYEIYQRLLDTTNGG